MLLEGVKSMIGLYPKCFANFMAFLKSHSSTTADIAGNIERMLGEQIDTHSLTPMQSMHNISYKG